MKKSNKIIVVPLALVLFFLSNINYCLAAGYYTNDVVEENLYVDKYFELDKNGLWKMNVYLGDQNLANISSSGTTTFPLVDHLGSVAIVTDSAGQVVETHDYFPFGSTNYQNLVNDSRTKKLFVGKETDTQNLLYYFGARYYDQNTGHFVSVDPFGQKLNQLDDQRLNAYLSDPQRLNSYSYASNNPINNYDADGNLSLKALAHPGATAAQLGFWYSGINSYLKPNGLDSSSALLEHSLSWQPQDISITSSNQKSYGNIIDKIKESDQYKTFLSKNLVLFEKENRNSFSDNDLKGNKSIEFSDGDLALAIGKAKISHFSGYKSKDGLWIVSMQFDDKYDFSKKGSAGEYNNDWFKTSANNAAYTSQNAGVISNFNIQIEFNDTVKN